MVWITFQEAVKRAKITERTGLNKRKELMKLDPKLYKQLFTDTRPIKVKDPEGVAFLRTDIKRFKKKLKVVTDAVVKRQNGFDNITKVYGERIITTPVTLAIEPDIKEILGSCKTPRDKERMTTAIKICYDYLAGYMPLDVCVTDAGIDQSTFVRWRRKSPEMQGLFKRAQVERNKALKERDTEDAIDAIRKLMKGYTVTEENKTYRIVTGYNGNEVLIPTTVTIREKHIQPSLGAAIYMSTNRDPENWKRNRSLDELFKEKARPEDIFEKMSDEELSEYIEKCDKKFGIRT